MVVIDMFLELLLCSEGSWTAIIVALVWTFGLVDLYVLDHVGRTTFKVLEADRTCPIFLLLILYAVFPDFCWGCAVGGIRRGSSRQRIW